MRYVLRHYANVLRIFYREPAFRALGLAAIFVLGCGAVFYHFVEHWGWLDALYFSTVTLATIGYGDLAPITEAGKAFTIVYIFFGLGIIAAFLTALARAPYVVDSRRAPGMPGSANPLTQGSTYPFDNWPAHRISADARSSDTLINADGAWFKDRRLK